GKSDSLTIGRARANIAMTRLLSRTVAIPTMSVRNVRLALTRYENGRLGPFDFPAGDSTASAADGGWAVELGVLSLSRGSVAYRDAPINLEVSQHSIGGMCRFARLDSLILDLNGRNGRLRFDTLNLDSLALRFDGAVWGRAMRFDETRIELPDAHLTLAGVLPFTPDVRLDATAHLAVRHRLTARLHPELAYLPPDGESVLDLVLQGALLSPALRLEVHSSDVRWRDFSASALACSASYDGASKAHAGIRVTTNGRGALSGRIDARVDSLYTAPRPNHYQLKAECARLDIPWLARVAGLDIAIPPAHCRATVTAAGTAVDDLPDTAHAAVTVDLLKPPRSAPARIAATLTLDRDSWKTSAALGQNTVNGSGTVSLSDGIRGSAHANVQDPSTLASLFVDDTLAGSATAGIAFQAAFDGTVSADATVSADSLAWRTAVIDTLHAAVIVRDGAVTLEHATAAGHAGLAGTLSRFDIDGVDGEIWYRGYAHGTISSPTAGLAIESPSLTIGSFGAYETACSLTIARDTVRWHNCRLQDSLLALSTDGMLALPSLFLDGTLRAGPAGNDNRARLAARGVIAPESLDIAISLGALSPSMAAAWLPNRKLPEGTLGADIGISGTIGNPTVSASIRAPSLAFESGRTLSVHMDAGLEDSLLRAELHAAAVDTQGVLRVHATVPVSPSSGWRIDWSRPDTPFVSWQTDTMDCGAFSPLLPPDIVLEGVATSQGTLQGHGGKWLIDGSVALTNGTIAHTGSGLRVTDVVVRGSADGSLESPRGAFVCSTGTLSYEGADRSISSITAWGRIDTSSIVLDTLDARFDRGGIVVQGRMPFGTGGMAGAAGLSVDAECTIDRFPLAMASPLVSGASIADGELSGDMRVRYTDASTRMDGQLRVDGLIVDLPELEPRVGPVTLRLTLAEDTVSVDTLVVSLDDHAMKGSGWVVLPRDGSLPLYVTASGTDLAFSYGELLDARVDSASFRLNGSSVPYRLDGRLVLDRSTYTRPVRLTDLATYIRSSSAVAPRPEADSVWRTVRLDVRVRTSSPVIVDLDIARVRATAETLVQGTPAQPQISGTVHLVDGHVWYLDRKFTIERGVFQLSDPSRLNPMLDLLAKTEVSPSMGLKSATRYKIRLHLTGTLDNPSVDLRSDPSLSQIDIVSLLTLGRVRNADEEALALETGSDLTDALAEKAKVIASQQLAGYVTRRVERWLNLDQVSIEGNIFGVGGNSGPRLSVSKQVRDRLTLTYQSVIGNIEEQTIKASLKLFPHVYLEGETDAQDNAGLDLKLKWSL
ncbi:MAG: hypothetical protein GF331_24860, partial [Chitinivibrionales bacterium]|nr:hypothetical protein [Chitinivibrionales bacterium]